MHISIFHHICIVFLLLWALSSYKYCHPIAYFISFIYLFSVNRRYVVQLRRKLQLEEKRRTNQRRVLPDSETVRWLNYAVQKIWPVSMEQIVSQKILLPIVPWFFKKYKPWTVRDAVVQHLYMGRSPPVFTNIRVLRQSSDDDHLVLELGMNFLTADDMSAILSVKLRRRLTLGMRAKLHLTGMHVEGKVLVGVKFLRRWPFIRRLRVCFVEPPYFQMIVKPLVAHGLDVTLLPGIAGWLDNLLTVAFKETLVQPNMLVVDVDKFASPQPDNLSNADANKPIAHVLVEVVEASDMKPSDINGLADPYVIGLLGPYKFLTRTQRKTLSPKWHEEFKIPICSWESANVLTLEVRDKDHLMDDLLGDCSVCIDDLRDSLRHDMWLSLQNIKMGRLHLAITVTEANGKGPDQPCDKEPLSNEKSSIVSDKFEYIDLEGKQETGMWIHSSDTEIAPVWETESGKNSLTDSASNNPSDSSSCDESQEHSEKQSKQNDDVPVSPHDNTMAASAEETRAKFLMQNNLAAPVSSLKVAGKSNMEGNEPGTSSRGHVKGRAKSMWKHAGKSARDLKCALSHKRLDKLKGEPGFVPAGRDISASENNTAASPVVQQVEGSSTVSSSTSGSRCDSFNYKGHSAQKSLDDPAVNTATDNICVEGSEKTSFKRSHNLENANELVLENLSSKIPDGNIGRG